MDWSTPLPGLTGGRLLSRNHSQSYGSSQPNPHEPDRLLFEQVPLRLRCPRRLAKTFLWKVLSGKWKGNSGLSYLRPLVSWVLVSNGSTIAKQVAKLNLKTCKGMLKKRSAFGLMDSTVSRPTVANWGVCEKAPTCLRCQTDVYKWTVQTASSSKTRAPRTARVRTIGNEWKSMVRLFSIQD